MYYPFTAMPSQRREANCGVNQKTWRSQLLELEYRSTIDGNNHRQSSKTWRGKCMILDREVLYIKFNDMGIAASGCLSLMIWMNASDQSHVCIFSVCSLSSVIVHQPSVNVRTYSDHHNIPQDGSRRNRPRHINHVVSNHNRAMAMSALQHDLPCMDAALLTRRSRCHRTLQPLSGHLRVSLPCHASTPRHRSLLLTYSTVFVYMSTRHRKRLSGRVQAREDTDKDEE